MELSKSGLLLIVLRKHIHCGASHKKGLIIGSGLVVGTLGKGSRRVFLWIEAARKQGFLDGWLT